MKKTINILLICFILLNFVLLPMSNIFATNDTEYASTFIDDIFGSGNKFFNPGNNNSNSDLEKGIVNVVNEIIEVVKVVGNIIIFICGAILGAKYVWSAASDKADAKGGLTVYVLGVIFFYCATAITDLAMGVLTGAFKGATSIEAVGGTIYSNIMVIINVCCVLAVIIVGLKYMFTTPEMKGEVKKRLMPIVIGTLLVYSTSQIIGFITNVASGVL